MNSKLFMVFRAGFHSSLKVFLIFQNYYFFSFENVSIIFFVIFCQNFFKFFIYFSKQIDYKVTSKKLIKCKTFSFIFTNFCLFFFLKITLKILMFIYFNLLFLLILVIFLNEILLFKQNVIIMMFDDHHQTNDFLNNQLYLNILNKQKKNKNKYLFILVQVYIYLRGVQEMLH